MSKVDGPVGVPFTESNNFKQGRGRDATTPKTMGPAVGHVSGNQTEGGGVNRRTNPRLGPMASGVRGYKG